MITAKEWRVVSVNMRGIFKVFGQNEEAARDFIEPRPRPVMINGKETMVTKRGGQLASDPNGVYRLEWRKAGTVGNDSTWTSEAVYAASA